MQVTRAVGAALGILLLGLAPLWGAPAPVTPDPAASRALQQYLREVAEHGKTTADQGIWLQSAYGVLGNHQGQIPLPAASLTKVATTLAALRSWGPNHHFATLLESTGPIRQGVLDGDLVVNGSSDPFFIWEDAFMIAHALSNLGITQVTGKLIIVGPFYMNFTANTEHAGRLLKLGFHSERWPAEAHAQYQNLARNLSKPRIRIAGPVQVVSTPPPDRQPLLRHHSLPLTQILKQMNIYSNNTMASMLATALGGPEQVERLVAVSTGIPSAELQLINGSGLGKDNQISPRAVCAMFMAIHRLLRPAKFTVADVFPVAGRDKGTIRRRQLPSDTVVKTGSLQGVSTLGGVIMTRKYGPVWFALLNQGDDLWGFRTQQDEFLQRLLESWGAMEPAPADFTPTLAEGERKRDDLLVTPVAYALRATAPAPAVRAATPPSAIRAATPPPVATPVAIKKKREEAIIPRKKR